MAHEAVSTAIGRARDTDSAAECRDYFVTWDMNPLDFIPHQEG
jgi:hypothetical protein